MGRRTGGTDNSVVEIGWGEVLLSFLLIAGVPLSLSADKIPFPQALEGANVELSSMEDGQGRSLMVGNGDLYGIVWERENSLFMRMTKNDIWDARIDTSRDGPMPRVDIPSRRVTGSAGEPPSYRKAYPQPRCAFGVNFLASRGQGGTGQPGTWSCVRRAASYGFIPAEDGDSARIYVEGKPLASTGFQCRLPETFPANSLLLGVRGEGQVEYFVDLIDPAGIPRYSSKWRRTSPKSGQIRLDFPTLKVGKVILYTRTLDGKRAVNTFSGVKLCAGESEYPLSFKELEESRGRGLLDIRRAAALIRKGGTRTEVRILDNANVALIRTPYRLAFSPIEAPSLPAAQLGKRGEMMWLKMDLPGDIDYRGMSYAAAIASKGELKAVSLVTSFDIGSREVLDAALSLAEKTLEREETQLVADHEKAWSGFWAKSGIEIEDRELQNLWFRMLYFARTVSRPGAAPVALMPPLATDITPWHADYHHNYNAWQAFWPLPAANHPELVDSWVGYINKSLPKFRYLAESRYGIDGLCFPISSFIHEPDPILSKSRNRRQIVMNPWGMTIGMGGMTLQSMWQRHLCCPDPAYMRKNLYPVLKGITRFYLTFIERCGKGKDGKILLGPSFSPEHGRMGIDDCPYDLGYVSYTLDTFIQASAELECDAKMADKCRQAKRLLGTYPTALNRQGEPVVVDWRGCRYREVPNHNIEVPSSPVFPCDQITWFSPEADKTLLMRTIRDTVKTGDNSHVMQNIAKSRLSMKEAIPDFKRFFSGRTLPNGFIRMPWAHGTFMQEQIGVVGFVTELLMQSVGNIIRVFPSWPRERNARFSSLRAQGGFSVSAEQRGGKVVMLRIGSPVGGTLRVLSPWKTISLNGKRLNPDSRGVVTLETRAGEHLDFTE